MGDLFNEDSGIELPEIDNNNQYNELITSGVEEALAQKEIKSVLLQSSYEIECPAYLLDMTNVGNITSESLIAIGGLLYGGDTAVYAKNNTEIMKIGYGDEQVLYTVLDGVIKQMYQGQCEIYKNRGKGFELTKEMEVDTVRLNL